MHIYYAILSILVSSIIKCSVLTIDIENEYYTKNHLKYFHLLPIVCKSPCYHKIDFLKCLRTTSRKS